MFVHLGQNDVRVQCKAGRLYSEMGLVGGGGVDEPEHT